jgi:hypothetical protein
MDLKKIGFEEAQNYVNQYASGSKTRNSCAFKINRGLNIEVKWIALLLHVQKIPDSNSGLKTSYPS